MNNYNGFSKYYNYFKNEAERYYLPEMLGTIGVIDSKELESRSIDSLYYIFPLIERLVVEILKYKPDSNIEFYEQGTYRTLNSILEVEENSKYFDVNLVNLIKTYYKDNGLRNKILHFKGESDITLTTIDLLTTKVIVVKLLKLYNLTLKQYDNIELNEITLL